MANSAAKLACNARWRENNRDRIRAADRLRNKAIKQEVLDYYGHKCAHCGFDNPLALVVDHINDNGAEQRREKGRNFSGFNFYRWLKNENWPEGYQILCANCNTIKEAERLLAMGM